MGVTVGGAPTATSAEAVGGIEEEFAALVETLALLSRCRGADQALEATTLELRHALADRTKLGAQIGDLECAFAKTAAAEPSSPAPPITSAPPELPRTAAPVPAPAISEQEFAVPSDASQTNFTPEQELTEFCRLRECILEQQILALKDPCALAVIEHMSRRVYSGSDSEAADAGTEQPVMLDSPSFQAAALARCEALLKLVRAEATWRTEMPDSTLRRAKFAELYPEVEKEAGSVKLKYGHYLKIIALIPPERRDALDALSKNITSLSRALGRQYFRMAMHAVSLVRHSKFQDDSRDDEQVAYMALDRGLLRFEPERGIRFGTYIHTTVWREIKRAGKADRTVHVPEYLFPYLRKYEQAVQICQTMRPSLEDVVQALQCSEAEGKKILRAVRLISESSTRSRDAVEPDSPSQDPEDLSPESAPTFQLERRDLHARLLGAIRASGAINDRDAEIVLARYGILDGVPQTLEQIGDRFQVSRERIRQLQERAFRILVRNPELRGLASSYFPVPPAPILTDDPPDISPEQEAQTPPPAVPPPPPESGEPRRLIQERDSESADSAEVARNVPAPQTAAAKAREILLNLLESHQRGLPFPSLGELARSTGINLSAFTYVFKALPEPLKDLYRELRKLGVDPAREKMKIKLRPPGEVTQAALAVLKSDDTLGPWREFLAVRRNELLADLASAIVRPLARGNYYQRGLQNIHGEFEDCEGAIMSACLQRVNRGFDIYNPARNEDFLSYVKQNTLHGISDFLRGQDPHTRGTRLAITRLAEVRREFKTKFGEAVVASGKLDSRIADAASLGMSLEEFETLLSYERPKSMYLDDDDGFRVRSDVAAAFETTVVGPLAEKDGICVVLATLLPRFSERDVTAYCLYNFGGLTMRLIGVALDLTESRVCQLIEPMQAYLESERPALEARLLGNSHLPPISAVNMRRAEKIMNDALFGPGEKSDGDVDSVRLI